MKVRIFLSLLKPIFQSQILEIASPKFTIIKTFLMFLSKNQTQENLRVLSLAKNIFLGRC